MSKWKYAWASQTTEYLRNVFELVMRKWESSKHNHSEWLSSDIEVVCFKTLGTKLTSVANQSRQTSKLQTMHTRSQTVPHLSICLSVHDDGFTNGWKTSSTESIRSETAFMCCGVLLNIHELLIWVEIDADARLIFSPTQFKSFTRKDSKPINWQQQVRSSDSHQWAHQCSIWYGIERSHHHPLPFLNIDRILRRALK